MTVDELLKKTDETVIVGDVLFSNENDKWYAHQIKINRKKNKMTNREWLESLSDERLADVLRNPCNGYCIHKQGCDGNCIEGVTTWLRQEHKEPKKEFTQDQLKKVFRDKFLERRAIGILEIEELIGELFE